MTGSSSACQWAEGRGNFVQFSRDPANGNLIKTGVVNDARTPPLFQTDLSIRHEIPVSKAREGLRLSFEAQAANLFNQRAKTAFYEFAIPTNLINPQRPSRFSGDPQTDWGKVMNGYNYVDALNGTGAFAGTLPGSSSPIQAPLTLASRYGQPVLFQTARNVRLQLRFTF